jgi:polysaccharide export outer membrane protein
MVLFCASTCLYAQDVSIVGSPQQANDRIKTLTMGKHGVEHDYVIGSGDLLAITVFDVPELTREVRVSQTGTISIPLIPARLTVTGLTELQAEQKIAEVLEANGLVSHPEVGVMVREHKSKPITIVGAVTHPMVYEADRTVTLLEALAEAGGVSNDAGDTVIVARIPAVFEEVDPKVIVDPPAPGAGVTTDPKGEPPGISATGVPQTAQKNGTVFPPNIEVTQNPPIPKDKTITTVDASSTNPRNTYTINLNELLETGDVRNNIVLEAGDVVTVPHAGIVYVLGAVNRPGGFVMANDRTALTTMKVLSLAGGLTRIAKLKHAYIIRTNDQGKQTQTEVDLKEILNREAEDIQMHASDILVIPDDRTKEALYRTAELAIGIGAGVALYRLAYH